MVRKKVTKDMIRCPHQVPGIYDDITTLANIPTCSTELFNDPLFRLTKALIGRHRSYPLVTGNTSVLLRDPVIGWGQFSKGKRRSSAGECHIIILERTFFFCEFFNFRTFQRAYRTAKY